MCVCVCFMWATQDLVDFGNMIIARVTSHLRGG